MIYDSKHRAARMSNKISNGLPCCDGTGYFAHPRNARLRPGTDGLPAPQLLRNFAAPRRPSVPALAPHANFSARRAWRNVGKGETPAQKHGAVCADRLARKWTARTSGAFIGAITTVPIKHESPLRQSADRKKPAVGLWRLQILEVKGWGATLLSSRVE